MMIKHGEAPFIECSSRGDKRFSAFYARIKGRGNKTIEELYQAFKVFDDGSTGLSIKEAKGRKATNQEAASAFYSLLWIEYMIENPDLLSIINKASGLSDMFGQKGHCCQATELWNMRTRDFLLVGRDGGKSYSSRIYSGTRPLSPEQHTSALAAFERAKND